jgi:phage terminase large subunit
MVDLVFYVPKKLKYFLTRKKRYKIVIGGRGSGKSMTLIDMLLYHAAEHGKKIFSMREFQSSIDDSSHALMVEEIGNIGIPGYDISKHTIQHYSGGLFRFKGLSARSIQAVKSASGFDFFHIEEAQFLSEESIRILTPTIRREASEIWIIANPGSREDPLSKRFLNFCWDILQEKGIYEDDRHLIILMNYYDNPMFPKVLEEERLYDLKTLPRALYDHIWLGDFNDFIENQLISKDWFDACVDAHEKLGIKPRGIKIATHDPSDEGADAKAVCLRHGILIQDVVQKDTGNINEGCDWATDISRTFQPDFFCWDADGVGIGLTRQISDTFKDSRTEVAMFKGSEGVDFPNAICEYVTDANVRGQKTNYEAFKNKRAQYFYELRRRCFNTYLAVEKKMYMNPDDLISFSSKITNFDRVRSEITRIPKKPSRIGMLELYTKDDMKRKFKLPSPNCADAVMMSMRIPYHKQPVVQRPEPIQIIRPAIGR